MVMKMVAADVAREYESRREAEREEAERRRRRREAEAEEERARERERARARQGEAKQQHEEKRAQGGRERVGRGGERAAKERGEDEGASESDGELMGDEGMKSDFERLLMSAGAAGSDFNLEQFVRRKGDLIEMDSDVLLSFGMAQVRLLPISAFG